MESNVTVEFDCPKCGERMDAIFYLNDQIEYVICAECDREIYVSRPGILLVARRVGIANE